MSDVTFRKHRVFRETQDVIFYDITVEESNASDLVVHTGAAISPPDDLVGAKQFYIHYHQIDYNRVVSGERTFELVNFDWKYPYHIVHLNRQSGALMIPVKTYHRSISGDDGSVVINQSSRTEGFDHNTEFVPVSAAENKRLYEILKHEKPVIHTLGE
ncbi:hemagglutinin [Prochlorococcus phage P-SSM3]|uniref:Redox protein n=1 Tax=Prochlorococcus phage P-SSM3 TaxID=536453 RepID=R9S778_9CAUD|nr:hemagglutinin [Prochlorococcus phage P-SSM3]AGN12150.1 redox protein [Prochlorococcus phage P-SSM3]